MRVTSRTGSTRKFVWEFEENKSRVLELAGARRTCARWGPLELGAKWIRQHRRLCLSSLRRNLLLKVNKKVSYLNKKSLRVFEIPVLYMFCSNEHYMSISHMAIFVYMATQHKELYSTAILHSLYAPWLTGAFWHCFASSTVVFWQYLDHIGQLHGVFSSQWMLTHFFHFIGSVMP